MSSYSINVPPFDFLKYFLPSFISPGITVGARTDNNGNIGIILENEYQNKGIGYQTMKLLIEKAQKEYKMKKIEISTGLHNKGMIRTCEKLGAELTSIEENCKYKIK